MRSPAAAIAWEFRHRHRWALIALALYLAVLSLIKPLFLAPGDTVRFDPPDGFAAFGVLPFSTTFMYFIAVFTFGLTGDVAARRSIYPPRLFTLPITTAALAGWPMLYGGVAMVTLWVTAVALARWPWGTELPLVWPALLATVVLAWTQVFMWLPYGLRGLRVIAAVVVLMTLDTVVLLALNLKWSEAALTAFLAPQLPVAYIAAYFAVRRARRGIVPDWSVGFRPRERDRTRPLPPFRTAGAAQLWFEWRRNGRSLPLLVAMVLPFELGSLFITGFGSTAFVFKVLAAALLTPILMAGFTAATVNKANPFARNTYGMTPFNATKPIATTSLIGAKLKMAMWSTVAAWAIVLALIALGFAWSGAGSVLAEWARWFTNHVGRPRAVVASVLGLGGLLVATWLTLVQGLCVGLTGQPWMIKTSGFVWLVVFMLIGPSLELIADSSAVLRWLWDNWPTVVAILVVLKIVAAIVIAWRLSRRRLFSDRALVAGAAAWAAIVFVLDGVFVWWADTPMLPGYLFLLIASLAVPLVRVSAAPLALNWNRHR